MTDDQHRDAATTADILAEVERRRAARRASSSRVILLADRVVFWISRHWLALLNAFLLLYIGLPTLAPILMHLGFEWPARLIYIAYRPLCHQLAHRSFFLFGAQPTYTLQELARWLGSDVTLGPQLQNFVGNDVAGYKIALCQRDVAIYGMLLLCGLTYGVLRMRWKIPSLPWWLLLPFGVAPMLLDGGYQMLSYILPLFWPNGPIHPHETTALMRVVTGALFGLGIAWFALPLVQETMEEMDRSAQRKFGGRGQ